MTSGESGHSHIRGPLYQCMLPVLELGLLWLFFELFNLFGAAVFRMEIVRNYSANYESN